MTLQFCGAAREVTGSCHLLTLDNGTKILLDCGLYQGRADHMRDFNERWLFDPAEIDVLILSHAHIDHAGRIPKLVKDGFRGKIYSTHATRSLCAIMLLDSAFIQERDAEWFNKRNQKRRPEHRRPAREALYTTKDIPATMKRFRGYPYDEWLDIGYGVELIFKDAGHILGSAGVALRITENGERRTLGFTGDIGRPDRPILRDPQPLPPCEYLLCESTYGDKDHETPPAELDRLLDIIKQTCVERRGKLIIPAFSVGRTQEIVYMLDQLETAGKLPRLPVYVDSPLAVNATEIFGVHPECFDDQLNEYLLIDDNPFGFKNLTYVRKVEVSKSLNDTNDPCIIISSSGMANAGRVRHHIYNSIENKRNGILIVGYCSPETLGGQLRAGRKEVRIFGEELTVRAEVTIMDSFSAHADRGEIAAHLANQKSVKKVFLVHGEIDRMNALAGYLGSRGIGDIDVPKLGEEVRL